MSERINRRKFLKIVGGGSAALALSACGATPEPTQVPATEAPQVLDTATPAPTNTPVPQVLKVRQYSDIMNLDPAFIVGVADQVVSRAIHEGLVVYGANSYDIENQLAESVEQVDDLTIAFKLKEGVQWHKGYGEVTTEDVKFSYERFIDPELNAEYRDDWANLDHVEIIDKYNGKIIMKAPQATLWTSTLPVVSGVVLCKKFAEEAGLDGLATSPIGCGRYMFDSWTPTQQVVLKANPDWHGGTPAYSEIQLFPMDDDKACEVALQAGEIDFGRISLASFDLFQNDASLKIAPYPRLYYAWFGMNVEHPILSDINVRQAIRYGIDVDSILAATYLGKAERENALIPPGLVGHWKDAPVYQRDVAKAKEYLAKAGKTSIDLRMDIQDTAEYRSWAQIAQQNLAEVGINITINPLDSSSFWVLGEGEAGKDVELFAMAYSCEPDPAWATMWFICDQVGIWNWMRWCDAQYDDLHKQGLVTMDKAKREEIYIEMQKLWDEACHTIWVTHGLNIYAYKPTIVPALTPNGWTQLAFFEPA